MTAQVTNEIALKTLKVFRREQKERTIGIYTGCYCQGCVECMRITLEEVLDDIHPKEINHA